MRGFLIIALFIVTFGSCGPSIAQDLLPKTDANYPDSKALIVNNCPYVELSGFSFSNAFADGGMQFSQNMKWKNVGKQALVAFEIVILKYDAFDRRLIGTQWTVTGTDSANWKPLEPDQSDGDGTNSPGEEEVYTGIAYVRLARLKDGTIWRANDTQLLSQLHNVAPDIEEFGDVKPDPKAKGK